MMQDIDEGIFNDNVRAAREALKHLNCNDKLWYSDKCKELKLHRMKRLGIKNQNEFKLVFNQCDLPPPYDDAKEMKRWKKHQRMLNDCAVFREAHYQQCVKEAEDTPHRNARVKLDEYAVACNKAARELRLQESRDSTPKVKDMTNVSSKEFMHDPEAQRSLDEARQLSEQRKLEKQERERLEEELAVRQQAEAEEKAKRDEHERLQRAAEKEANRLIEEERERKAKAARAKEKKKAKAKRYAKNKANTKAESETKRANDEAKGRRRGCARGARRRRALARARSFRPDRARRCRLFRAVREGRAPARFRDLAEPLRRPVLPGKPPAEVLPERSPRARP